MGIEIDADLLERDLLELARYGAYGETGVWRTVYSPEWVAAQDQVASLVCGSGPEVRRDAVGSVWGRLGGEEARRACRLRPVRILIRRRRGAVTTAP